jgi:hypothetical protein
MGTKRQAADRINAMSPQEYKIFENRLRRMAQRQGLTVLKSRTRDPRAIDYLGYMIARDGTVVAGHAGRDWQMGIDDVERYLLEDRPPIR